MNVDSTIITIAFLLLIIYYVYICILAVLVKAPEERLTGHERRRFIFLVPCRNEEKVIAVTIRRILEIDYPHVEVLVINDGSTDRTEEVVSGFTGSGKVEVVNTEDPGRGKGEALNFGFRKIIDRLEGSGASNYEDIVIGILDADGQPSMNICRAADVFFDDPQVGAVQGAVRIANAESNTVAACQDIEFIGFSQAIQKGRDRLCSVGLGGNGQFTRLSALCTLSLENPWNQSLTEDLDIGLRLILEGWKVRFCSRAYVAQQGVEKVRPLVVQRVRWMQGHYSSWKYVPRFIVNGNLPLRTRIDNCLYLLFGATPFIVFLSILFSFLSAVRLFTVSNKLSDFLLGANFFLYLLVLYLLSFVVAMVFVTFYMRYKKISIWKMIFLYHVFAIYTMLWIPAAMGAVLKMIRGQKAWVKTGRTAVDEFTQLRLYPRMEASIPVELSGDGVSVDAIVKDISKGGAGIEMTRRYYVQKAIDAVSTGNKITLTAPETGREVLCDVVWVAYLGFRQVRAGLRFMDPGELDIRDEFGLDEMQKGA